MQEKNDQIEYISTIMTIFFMRFHLHFIEFLLWVGRITSASRWTPCLWNAFIFEQCTAYCFLRLHLYLYLYSFSFSFYRNSVVLSINCDESLVCQCKIIPYSLEVSFSYDLCIIVPIFGQFNSQFSRTNDVYVYNYYISILSICVSPSCCLKSCIS